jgi:hypothetical protein
MREAIEYAYRKAVRVGTVMALAATIVVGASVTPAAAQSRQFYYQDNAYRGRRVTANDIRRIATINGYSEGYEDGLQARRGRRSFNQYQSTDMYRQGNWGYQSDWGDSRIYQASFREGYRRGYSDGFYSRNRNRGFDRSQITVYYPNGYPNYNRNSVGSDFTQRALQQGYYDGFYRGQYDRGQGIKRPNPQGHGAYEFALNGWEQDWGNSGAYQQTYRQAFMEGYQDGYGNRAFRQNYRPRY